MGKYNAKKYLNFSIIKVIRNRLKAVSAIKNSQIFLNIQEEYDSFDKYFWAFIDGVLIKNTFNRLSDIPAKTKLLNKISKDLQEKRNEFCWPNNYL